MSSLSNITDTLRESNNDLLEISMENMSLQENGNQILSGVYECLKSIEGILMEVSLDLLDFFQKQEEFSDRLLQMQPGMRSNKASDDLDQLDELDKLEEKRESKVVGKERGKEKTSSPKIEKAKESIFDIAKKILLGGTIVLLLKNIDQVEAFVKDKLIPAIVKTFTFMKDTVFPFIVENFDSIVSSIFYAAGLIVGANLGVKIFKAITFLVKGVQMFRLFMLGSFIPAITGLFSTIITALTPVIIAAAPFIAIGLAIGAVLFGLYKLLEKVTENLGFDSIGETLMYAVLKIKDAFFGFINFFLGLYNKVIKFVKGAINLVPDFLLTDEMKEFANSSSAGEAKMLDTNSAEKYRQQKLEEKESGDESAGQGEKGGDDSGKSEKLTKAEEELAYLKEERAREQEGFDNAKTRPEKSEKMQWIKSYDKAIAQKEQEIQQIKEEEGVPQSSPGRRVRGGSGTESESMSESLVGRKVGGVLVEKNGETVDPSTLSDEEKTRINAARQAAVAMGNPDPYPELGNMVVAAPPKRQEQTQQLQQATAENLAAKAAPAPSIIAPNNSNVNNSTNVNQTVAMPMPPSNDLSDKYYASVFGAR